ncbi:hypothetical protein [Flagellimonas sp.]|uniref:hypothetical protein n=1 Tax=Flagellimonas sp. TaxID=2058762 RepID=UPI003B5081E2
MASEKKSGSAFIFIGGVVFCAFLMFVMGSSETNNSVVNLVLKEGDKTYVYAHLGTQEVQKSIQKDESPTVFPFIQIFEDDGKLYVSPDRLRPIVNLICGNYNIHHYPEKSIDGYVTLDSSSCFESSFKNLSTEKIGEQIRLNTIQLTAAPSEAAFNIRWETKVTTNTSKALENCHEKSFTIRTSVQPGEYVFAPEDFIMVDLAEVVDFYGNKVRLRFNEEEQLLYVEHNP